MDLNTLAQSAPGMSSATREQFAAMQKRIEELQKQHPESSDKLGSGFWIPGMQLGNDINTNLDPSTKERLNTCITSILASKFDPAVLVDKRAEVKSILIDHPDMAETMDLMIFQNEAAWASLQDYAVKKEAEGVDVLGSCAMPEK